MDALDAHFADLLADAPGARPALAACRAAAQQRGDVATAWQAAAATLLQTVVDFGDFRGLPSALQAFADGEQATPPLPRPIDRLRIDAARLARPLLDHHFAADDAALKPVRERVFAAVRAGDDLSPDERVLMAKVLVEHDGFLNDVPAVERVLTLVQDPLQQGGVSPAWQCRWWLLVVNNGEYWGRLALAQEALQQAQALADRHGLPAMRLACLCHEMRLALRADDLQRGERLFQQIEQLRPHVPATALLHGLRLQVALQLRRAEHHAALERCELLLALCDDHEVPERERGGYHEMRAHAFTGLGRHDEAIAVFEAMRPHQAAGQGEVLEALIGLARTVQALHLGTPDARLQAADALRRSAAIGFNRFLMPHPAWAAQVAAIGLDDGVETEFVNTSIRARRLAPPEPWREDWPWRVHVHAFGGLRVQVDGLLLGPAGAKAAKKPAELLVALASQGNEPVAASRLIDLLWPSLEANAPKASLEMALTRLRKWLGVPDAVLMADGNLRLNPALVWTDVGAFMAASRHPAASSALVALGLYRGPLLGTEPLASLPQRAREQLAARHERLAVDAILSLTAQGDVAAAARCCEQALEHAPLAEPLYRALMQLQLQAGEQAQALRTWARCEARLKAELGVAPSSQTRELLAQLR